MGISLLIPPNFNQSQAMDTLHVIGARKNFDVHYSPHMFWFGSFGGFRLAGILKGVHRPPYYRSKCQKEPLC